MEEPISSRVRSRSVRARASTGGVSILDILDSWRLQVGGSAGEEQAGTVGDPSNHGHYDGQVARLEYLA